MLVRDTPQDIEVFMLRRTSKAAFAGGMHVFPGGRVDGEDHFDKYRALCSGPTTEQAAQVKALGHEHLGYWIAGIRETFEEAGFLLAYDAGGNLVSYDDTAQAEQFAALRTPLHDGALTLFEICEARELRLAIDRVHLFNRFVTPQGRPRRFDTRFFVAAAPPGQTGEHDRQETVDSVWITPAAALERHAADDFGLMRVTERQLTELAQFRSSAELIAAVSSKARYPVYRP